MNTASNKATETSNVTYFDLNGLLDATRRENEAASAAVVPRVRTTLPQRAALLNMLDPVEFPLPSGRHGGCCHKLENMGFATYNMTRDVDGRMLGWVLTPAGREKAEALRAVVREAARSAK